MYRKDWGWQVWMDEELNPHLLHWLAIINLETQGNIVDKTAERFESAASGEWKTRICIGAGEAL